jgi:hypothetical protein
MICLFFRPQLIATLLDTNGQHGAPPPAYQHLESFPDTFRRGRSERAEIRHRMAGDGDWLQTAEGRRATNDDGELSDQQIRGFLLQTRTLRYPALNPISSPRKQCALRTWC